MQKEYLSILDWIISEKIKNEKGELIEFDNHPFLEDIFLENSQELVVMKAAQVGMTTCEMLKNHFDAKKYNIDIIYTLPTDNDVKLMVAGKTNRIIANNPCMILDVADKDSIESKKVGDAMIYFRGTWTKKSAMMTTADRLVHDEKDISKMDIIADYQARLQHSQHKQIHSFSHPSLPHTGIHNDWLNSNQKHWIVECPHCFFKQFLSWNTDNPDKMSINIEKKVFVCKKCKKEIPDYVRRAGEWVSRYPSREKSGYWAPLLIAPWISAEYIIERFKNPDTTQEFFYTKILGLPFADGTAKLLKNDFYQNLTGQAYAPTSDERVVIGIDTGLKIDYVIGNTYGLFYHGACDDYDELDKLMRRWSRAIAVIDQGGDLIGSRKFYQRWPGRVFLCMFGTDRKTKELVRWGRGDEQGAVTADRNRMIQLVIDEFRNKRIVVHGTEDDWHEYYLDWNNLSKRKVLDPDTNQTKGYKWVRSGRDHKALATVYWRVGMARFSGTGFLINSAAETDIEPNSYMINEDNTVDINLNKFLEIENALNELEEEEL